MLLLLRHPRTWLVLGWLLVVLVIIVSILPISHLPQPPGLSDKMEHLVAYTLLSLWFAGIYPRSSYGLIAIGLFSMGLLIEWAQGAMPFGRYSDFRDIVANAIGIGVGLALAFVGLGGWAQRVETWTRKS